MRRDCRCRPLTPCSMMKSRQGHRGAIVVVPPVRRKIAREAPSLFRGESGSGGGCEAALIILLRVPLLHTLWQRLEHNVPKGAPRRRPPTVRRVFHVPMFTQRRAPRSRMAAVANRPPPRPPPAPACQWAPTMPFHRQETLQPGITIIDAHYRPERGRSGAGQIHEAQPSTAS